MVKQETSSATLALNLPTHCYSTSSFCHCAVGVELPLVMVDGTGVKLQLTDLPLIDGMLDLKSEIGYVASGNILSCNILRSDIYSEVTGSGASMAWWVWVIWPWAGEHRLALRYSAGKQKGGEERRLHTAGEKSQTPVWAVIYVPIQETLFSHSSINTTQTPYRGGCISIWSSDKCLELPSTHHGQLPYSNKL